MSGDQPKVGMTLFLLTFFLIYGGLHVYIFVKIKNALPLGMLARLFLMTFMIVMVFAPLSIRMLERINYEEPARILSYVGYTWTGIAFLFFSIALVLDIYRLSLNIGGAMFSHDLSSVTPSAMHLFLIPMICSAAFSTYGFFEARSIRTERLKIETPKLPQEVGTLKIVQISDVHLGLVVREDRLGKILNVVKREQPDIFVSTGDLVDGQICRLDGILKMLDDVKAPYGKFAVTGNHEFYAGLKQALECTIKSGFTTLRGETVTIPGLITLAGVDDPAVRIYQTKNPVSDTAVLSQAPSDTFTVLLKHQPIVDKESLGLFDLQLSGHTHRGQIFPFGLITRLRYQYNAGYYRLENGSHLYVSRGSGTWGPPIRFLSPPEVTVIELVHADAIK